MGHLGSFSANLTVLATEDIPAGSDNPTRALIKKFVNAEYDGSGIREYIMKMTDMAEQLKSYDMEQKDDFVVHHVLNSLLKKFETFIVNYNISAEKWTIEKCIVMCVQEEERIKAQKNRSLGSVYHVKSSWIFARFLQENGIVTQYSTPGEPQQNGVAERRNHTLMDMEPFSSIPAVVAAPVVAAPAGCSLSASVSEPEAPVVTVELQVSTAANEEPEQPPEGEGSASEPAQEPLRRSQ
ncbi:hypothetical protein U9M48_027228 [Paspalum notatum var. saurae]|uniref:Integrase catalytic domain-containing protein n=1 Tax=Paspalum notatum var. saurae TaxID=547442 RepID=A0AAQ3WZV5_PASNO